MVSRTRSTSSKLKQQQIYYQQQQIQGPSQIRYQKKKAQDAKELFEYIGINQPNSSNNTNWKNFTNALRASVYQLYVEKAKQYAKKIQEITTDNKMNEFVKFLDKNIRHTSQTTQTITNLKKELLVKFGEQNFELILGKFNKNNECNNIMQNLKKDYGITESSPPTFNQTTVSPKFVRNLTPRHENLYKTLKKIYHKNIGLGNYLGILKMLLVFSVKPEFLTNRQTPLYINYAITGLPGTGKSYIASLLGEILQHSGILLKNKFSTLESFDFIGEYVGQSGPKTYNTLLKNMESVVFIDEVYNIARCNGDMVQNTKDCKPNQKCKKVKCTKFDQYSTEACTEIVKFISENPGCIAIIVAGYEDGDLGVKNTFFKINEGLSRRFPAENRIKMKPVLSEDAIAKVKAILQQYNIHKDQTKKLKLASSNLYTLFVNSLLQLEQGSVLKENYSSLNRIVKDFIEWLTLQNMKNNNVTRELAREKISKLFTSNTFNKMDQNTEKIAQKYLTAKEKQTRKRQQQRK